jgi:hypothetical protein
LDGSGDIPVNHDRPAVAGIAVDTIDVQLFVDKLLNQ